MKIVQFVVIIITPHEQRKRGKVIGVGVHICIYVCLWTKKIKSYFSDRLIFSNIHGMTSHRIYQLALLLHSPETLIIVA